MENPYLAMLRTALGELVPVLPYFLGIVAFVVAWRALEARFGRKKGRRWRGRSGRNRYGRDNVREFRRGHDPLQERASDPADQLRTVMQADFKPQRLLNKSEARLFKAIDKMVLSIRPDWQVMAQVSLGEILRCDDKAAYWCINAKRVDLLIVDEECRPVHAIEYQGAGRAAEGAVFPLQIKRPGGFLRCRRPPMLKARLRGADPPAVVEDAPAAPDADV